MPSSSDSLTALHQGHHLVQVRNHLLLVRTHECMGMACARQTLLELAELFCRSDSSNAETRCWGSRQKEIFCKSSVDPWGWFYQLSDCQGGNREFHGWAERSKMMNNPPTHNVIFPIFSISLFFCAIAIISSNQQKSFIEGSLEMKLPDNMDI